MVPPEVLGWYTMCYGCLKLLLDTTCIKKAKGIPENLLDNNIYTLGKITLYNVATTQFLGLH